MVYYSGISGQLLNWSTIFIPRIEIFISFLCCSRARTVVREAPGVVTRKCNIRDSLVKTLAIIGVCYFITAPFVGRRRFSRARATRFFFFFFNSRPSPHLFNNVFAPAAVNAAHLYRWHVYLIEVVKRRLAPEPKRCASFRKYPAVCVANDSDNGETKVALRDWGTEDERFC